MSKKYLYSIIILLLFLSGPVFAQDDDEKNVIQFTGLVVEGDSMYGLPFVHVYVPNTPRGAITSNYGYFSMAVYTGDSVIFDMIGYKDEHFIIPEDAEENMSVIVHLEPDTTVMAVVEIYPYPNLEAFKKAFLALDLPQRDIDNMNENLNERLMKRMLYHSGADGSMNHRYFMETQVVQTEQQFFYPTVPLLDPFAWARFFKDLKKYKKKKAAGEYDYLDDE